MLLLRPGGDDERTGATEGEGSRAPKLNRARVHGIRAPSGHRRRPYNGAGVVDSTSVHELYPSPHETTEAASPGIGGVFL